MVWRSLESKRNIFFLLRYAITWNASSVGCAIFYIYKSGNFLYILKPAFVHTGVDSKVLYFLKATMFEGKFCTVIFRIQFPDNNGIERNFSLPGPAFP